MALIECPGCGSMVSQYAEKCPKCWFKIKKTDATSTELEKKNLYTNIDFSCIGEDKKRAFRADDGEVIKFAGIDFVKYDCDDCVLLYSLEAAYLVKLDNVKEITDVYEACDKGIWGRWKILMENDNCETEWIRKFNIDEGELGVEFRTSIGSYLYEDDFSMYKLGTLTYNGNSVPEIFAFGQGILKGNWYIDWRETNGNIHKNSLTEMFESGMADVEFGVRIKAVICKY